MVCCFWSFVRGASLTSAVARSRIAWARTGDDDDSSCSSGAPESTGRPAGATALSGTAFATLLLIAFMMGANHVAARIAFDHGVDVATAVTRSQRVTALVVALLVVVQRVPVR